LLILHFKSEKNVKNNKKNRRANIWRRFSGMNAAIRSVVRTCAFYNIECLGIYRGYQGMIEGDFKEMGPEV
jgi:6-phosphofructokinase 1